MYKEGSVEWIKMIKAFCCMLLRQSDNQKRYLNSHWYQYYKQNFSKIQSLQQIGNKNSQYGTRWIFNKHIKQNKKICKLDLNAYLNQGWEEGRVLNWDSYFQRLKNKEQQKVQKQLEKQKKLQENIILYTNYYKIYNDFGWDVFKQKTNWKFSKSLLVMRFKKFVKEFKPQNGKRRGNTCSQIH